MNNLTLFLVEVALCFSLSLVVIVLLRPCLNDVLLESCGTRQRAGFWVMFTQLMLVLAPLLLVIFFSDVRPGVADYPAQEIKDSLFRSLLGIFAAIAMVGRSIWKSVAADLTRNHGEGDPERAAAK